MYTTNRKPNRKKELIIRKSKNTNLDKKYIDDEELEKQYIENEDEDNSDNYTSTNKEICPNFILNIIKKEWDASYGEKIYGEFPASTCKLIKPQKDKPIIVGCRGYIKECDKKRIREEKER